MRRIAWRPARRNRASALDRLRRCCASSPGHARSLSRSACRGAGTCGERTPRVTIGGRHHRCTVMSRVGLVCSQADQRNAGFEPALPAPLAGALPTELIPGRLGAHKTLGTHRAMGSVSAPDGQENPNQGTRTPPNLKLTGCPVVGAMTAWSLSPPLDSLSSVNEKPCSTIRPGLSSSSWKDAFAHRLPGDRGRVSACLPRRRWQARGYSATGERAVTATPLTLRSCSPLF